MIVALAVSLVAVAGFAAVLWFTAIGRLARRGATEAVSGISIMLDAEVDDDAKERAVRRAGLSLIATGGGLLLRLVLAVAIAAAVIVAADRTGVAGQSDTVMLMLRADWIVGITVAALALSLLFRLVARPQRAPGAAGYSATDRLVHDVAFASPRVLRAAASVEDKLFGPPAQTTGPPVFVTSLARAGTTALLTAMSRHPGLATFRYRDMPFLTSPKLWQRLSGGDRRWVERRERAHEDGLSIDLNTPEAFDEVLWKMFWPHHYQDPRITLWSEADRNTKAEAFIERTMARLCALRGRDRQTRYLSKNNAHVARLAYLPGVFPDARIVVPLRRPGPHAASLQRQHARFVRLQADGFTRRFMRDLGHYEFGRLHKPFAFPGFEPESHHSDTLDYWHAYWVACYEEVRRHRQHCVFVLLDDLRDDPIGTLDALSSNLGLMRTPWPEHGIRGTPDRESPATPAAEALYRDLAGGTGVIRAAS